MFRKDGLSVQILTCIQTFRNIYFPNIFESPRETQKILSLIFVIFFPKYIYIYILLMSSRPYQLIFIIIFFQKKRSLVSSRPR